MRSNRRQAFLAFVAAGSLLLVAADAFASLVAFWNLDEAADATVAQDGVGNVDGALSGGAFFEPGKGVVGGALSLDGATTSYVSMGVALDPAGSSFSISAWIRNSQPGSAFNVIVGKHQAGVLNGYFLALNSNPPSGGTADHAFFYVSNASGAAPNSTTAVNDFCWHHVVGTYSAAGNNSIYVDGAPAQDARASAPYVSNGAPFLLGGLNDPTPTGHFTGLIDEVGVYDAALTAQEVADLHATYPIFVDDFESGAPNCWSLTSP